MVSKTDIEVVTRMTLDEAIALEANLGKQTGDQLGTLSPFWDVLSASLDKAKNTLEDRCV